MLKRNNNVTQNLKEHSFSAVCTFCKSKIISYILGAERYPIKFY